MENPVSQGSNKSNQVTCITAKEAARILHLKEKESQALFDPQVIKNVRVGTTHLTTEEYLNEFKNSFLKDDNIKKTVEEDVNLYKLYYGG